MKILIFQLTNSGITRAILLQSNVPVPSGLVLSKLDDIDYKGPFPAVVKPTKMENSVGVSLVLDKTGLDDAMQTAWKFGSTAIIDTFIGKWQKMQKNLSSLGEAS